MSQVPVIFLSAYGRDQVIARALEAGADDYIVKPFSPAELVARIQAALRRRTQAERPEPSEPCVVGDLVVNFRRATSDSERPCSRVDGHRVPRAGRTGGQCRSGGWFTVTCYGVSGVRSTRGARGQCATS